MPTYRSVASVVIAFLLAALTCPQTDACATLARRPFAVASENAVIVWNEKAHTEHFIRTATFQSGADDIGFIVPTPSTPTLTTADNKVIDNLDTVIAPKVLRGDRYDTMPFPMIEIPLGFFMTHIVASERPQSVKEADIRVESVQTVAGLDATTLSADNTSALSVWLKAHHYNWTPQLADWLEPYVAKGWKITAFRYAKHTGNAPGLSTDLLDLTFQTDRPFYPYREPVSRVEPGLATPYHGRRTLRIFFLATQREAGQMETNTLGQQWPGNATYARPINASTASAIASILKLPSDEVPNGTWLTSFDDDSSPRPGVADVFFTRDPTQAELTPRPFDQRTGHLVVIPLDALIIAAIVGIIVRRRKNRSRRRGPQDNVTLGIPLP